MPWYRIRRFVGVAIYFLVVMTAGYLLVECFPSLGVSPYLGGFAGWLVAFNTVVWWNISE